MTAGFDFSVVRAAMKRIAIYWLRALLAIPVALVSALAAWIIIPFLMFPLPEIAQSVAQVTSPILLALYVGWLVFPRRSLP